MNRSVLQQHLAGKTGICLGVGGALWAYLLIKGAFVLRDHTASVQYDIQIGSLLLNRLGKHHLPNEGFMINFSFEPGLVWYMTICCAVGIAWGCFSFFRHYHRQPPKE